jgi:CspA family cold shock protein
MASLSGTVAQFDDGAGLGTIVGADGTAYPFHCTQIADGTRTIAEGTAVTFELLPRLGRWEATTITPATR